MNETYFEMFLMEHWPKGGQKDWTQEDMRAAFSKGAQIQASLIVDSIKEHIKDAKDTETEDTKVSRDYLLALENALKIFNDQSP